jgi:hypothetical protein
VAAFVRLTGIEGVDAAVDFLLEDTTSVSEKVALALLVDVERLIDRHDTALQLLVPTDRRAGPHLDTYRKAVRRAIAKVDDLIG